MSKPCQTRREELAEEVRKKFLKRVQKQKSRKCFWERPIGHCYHHNRPYVMECCNCGKKQSVDY